MINIRPYTHSDAGSVSLVIRQTMRISNSRDYPIERLLPLIDYFSPEKVDLLNDERQCLVAEVEQQIVGTAALEGAELCTFFVLPDYQGQGIGAKLLAALEQIASESAIDTIHVAASVTGALFYQRMGYVPTGAEHDGTAGRQIHLVKQLSVAGFLDAPAARLYPDAVSTCRRV
jgi:GNAT superfamily N-acetyltransferase